MDKNNLKPQIVYVLGGPGSGKGTQCERLVRDFKFHHISVGDVMRAEIANKTEDGIFIKGLVSKGEIVPTEITVKLLLKTIKSSSSKKFLIDGFPRGLEQAIKLENLFQEIDYILNFDCPEEILVERLLDRGRTSGRADDNEETIRNRIKVFNSSTKPALDFYWRFGKVHTISSIGSIEQVYSQVLIHLQKNLVFLYGAPSIGKTDLALALSQVTGYQHIELRELWNKNKMNEEEKINMLMQFLANSREENFLIDGFFESKKQAKIFIETFQKPNHVFYLETTKDFVDEHLLALGSKEKGMIYKEFVKNRKELVDFFSKDPNFVKMRVNNQIPILSHYTKIVNNYLAPEVYMAIYDDNQSLFEWYVEALERDKNFVHLRLDKLLGQEAERRTALGLEIAKYSLDAVPLELQVALLRKILFTQTKRWKYLITGYPNTFEAYHYFEENCREISFVISFEPEGQGIPFVCNQEPSFNPQTYYHTLGKHMIIDRNSLALFDHYTQKKNTYYITIAPPYFERAKISKHIADKFGFIFVEWEETITKLKEKLGGEDGPVDEVTFAQILKNFQDVFKQLQGKGTALMFDGFPYPITDLNLFAETLGAPKGVLNMEMTKESVIKTYKSSKELEADAEVPEEELEEISKGKQKHDEFATNLEAISEKGFGTNFYKINANISMSTIRNSCESLFFKRVYLASHSFPIYDEGLLDDKFLQIFANVASKHQVTFLDIRALIRKEFKDEGVLFEKFNSQYLMRWSEKPYDFPSNYTPELIMELVKKHLASLSVQSREILIYNYPMGDYEHDRTLEECCFPRALDELAMIEAMLGQIRMIFSINEGSAPNKEYSDAIEEFPPEELVVKVEEKKEGEEENPDKKEEENKEEEDGQEKKFNPKEFTWTLSNGCPKKTSQVYNKMKPVVWETIDLQKANWNYEEIDGVFSKNKQLINEGNEDNYFVEVIYTVEQGGAPPEEDDVGMDLFG